ncbi:HCNGP-like protein-domain-containing protein [Lasiosphaeris hirsuta]|uniref:HCNGP-like protein-domain-containing protein n=1 Tax=Lasiosphaeris hirsuta TaxID=260670 RepID=A0AA40EA93_9PEZI|nr:HCNGP-like protein-domain-containing protein [Lasiosphaeris hirsuta]
MGLVQYESSDEDEDVKVEEAAPPKPAGSSSASKRQYNSAATAPSPKPQGPAPPKPTTTRLGPVLGPAMGPPPPPPATAADPAAMDVDTEVDLSFLTDAPDPSAPAADAPPRSPYSAARSLARDLTLPAVANMDIPPSPPPTSDSPDPGLDALNSKFDSFLRLKRTKGVHFNARLAASSALRNPGLMDKLLGFSGLETDFWAADKDGAATGQYATTLGRDVWDPAAFPDWAYRGPLRRAQDQANRDRERAKGEAVAFVPASASAVGEEGTVGTAAVAVSAGEAPVRGKRRTMFDT